MITTTLTMLWALIYFLLLMKAARLTREIKVRTPSILLVVVFMALWPLWSLALVGVWLIGVKAVESGDGDA